MQDDEEVKEVKDSATGAKCVQIGKDTAERLKKLGEASDLAAAQS